MFRNAGCTRIRTGSPRVRSTTWAAGSLAAALALAACSSAPPPPPPPTTIQLTVVGAKALNPDPNGRPSPVMLRLYQLGPSDAFTNADFFQIIDQDKATLGPTLLDRQELAVAPDSRQTLTVQPKPEVKTLAVAAAFRAYEEAGWRALGTIQPNKANRFLLTATASTVTLTPRGEGEADDAKAGAEAGTAEEEAKTDPKADAAAPKAEAPKTEPPKSESAPNAAGQPPAATHNLIVKGAS
ncbi:type VI secretion system lipoprotein TssJ [Azospirillum sp. HJ39]|uniref:type VI secretion system lipoprotein TssJ n=1 Tax=Azospirillum sp. HJ39 TaxID=3159496 RepID=UPI0035568343